VHLIAHDRKPGPGEGQSSRYNISGSGALSNLADNCISVGRNSKKAEKLADITLSEEDRREITAQSDGKIVISKQRHGPSWTGTVKLYFSPYSMRFSTDRNAADLAIPEIKTMAELGPTNTRGYGA
jgi:twinkle protein